MILVAGGTGTLGAHVVRALTADGADVRVLTRDARRADHLAGAHVEVVVGDVRDRDVVDSAVDGADAVVSAVQGFVGDDPVGGQAVDVDGNANLVRTAVRAGTRRFVLVSAAGAAADSTFDLRRLKHRAEQVVKESGLAWTVVRPTVYLETWLGVLDDMIAKRGWVTLFGRGDNPIEFVSAVDVAALVAHAVRSPDLAGATLELGGPERLTLNELVARVVARHDRDVRVRHVPLPVVRAVANAFRPLRSQVATLARFAVVMDTTDMTLARDTAREAVPDLLATRLGDVLSHSGAHPAHPG
jgi:uncharacterized protein YbjT (DUF2867 family)